MLNLYFTLHWCAICFSNHHFILVHLVYQVWSHVSALPDLKGMKINYFPYHAVLKKESTLTELRVIFDASSPMFGKSLTICWWVTIQSELFDTLLRFRQYPYVVTGDCQDV